MQINNNKISNFNKISINGYSVFVHKDFPEDKLPLPLGKFTDQLTPVACSKFAIINTVEVDVENRTRLLYVKEHLSRSFTDKLKHLFRPSRGRRALTAGAMLTENGFDSPQVIALAEKHIGPICTENILITEQLNNARSISEWEKDWSSQQNCVVVVKRKFVKQLGKTIGKMHARNISHGDLRPGNVYSQQIKDSWNFYFLDNERTVQMNVLPLKLRIKNLVQINMLAKTWFTYTDRMRFYKSYLKENPQLKNKAKPLAKEIVRITHQRLSGKIPADQI